MSINRRQFVVGSGTVLIGAIGVGAGTNVLADEHEIPVVIAAVYEEDEYIILENKSEESVDVSGYQINWEHGQETDQIRPLPSETTIDAGGQLRVATGATDVEADVTFDYDRAEIRNDGSDVIALLSPSGEVVATSDGAVQPPEPEPPEDEEEEEEDDDAGEDEEETEEDGESAEDTDGEDDTGATDEDGEKERERETDEDDC